jgi:hypothetical protein
MDKKDLLKHKKQIHRETRLIDKEIERLKKLKRWDEPEQKRFISLINYIERQYLQHLNASNNFRKKR